VRIPIGIGFAILAVIAAMSVVARDIGIAIKGSGYVGLAALLLAALYSGALIDPDSRRVDSATETRESLNWRIKVSTFFVLIAAPNLTACLVLYFGSTLL